MNIYAAGLLWVAGSAALAALIAYLIRKYGEDEGREANNTAASTVFSIVGGLNAVLVAFVLIALFDAVGKASDDSYREADGLVAAVWAADSLPDATKDKVRQLSRAYASNVIDKEWPRMQDGTAVDPVGWGQLDEMRLAVSNTQTDDGWQTDRKTEAATQLWDVYQARQSRLNASGNGVTEVVWFTLIAGCLLALALPLTFGGPRARAQVVIVATLAATMALLLFATYQLQNPFSGGAQVGPDAFRAALDRLR
jgi:hypothetical protein